EKCLTGWSAKDFAGGVVQTALENHATALENLRGRLDRDDLFKGIATDAFRLQTSDAFKAITDGISESAAMKDFVSRTQVSFKDLAAERLDIAKMFEPVVEAFLPARESLLSSFAQLQSSWQNPEIPMHSIEGMAGLLSLRNAIDATPFSDV